MQLEQGREGKIIHHSIPFKYVYIFLFLQYIFYAFMYIQHEIITIFN